MAVSRLRRALGLAEDKHTVKLQGCHGRDLIGLFLDAQFEEHELVTRMRNVAGHNSRCR